MWWSNNSERGRRGSTVTTTLVVATLLSVGEVQNLKCRTTDHSSRQGEFVDIAEQCKNMTTSGGDRSTGMTSLTDSDYSSQSTGQRYSGNDGSDRDSGGRDKNNKNNNHRRNAGGDGGRRNNNREYSVRRQDFAGGYNNDNNNNNNNNNRGNDDNNDRGHGDRESTSCDNHPRQYSSSGNNEGRQWNYRQGSSNSPSVNFDGRQSSNPENRQQSNRRYRRDTDNNNKINNHRTRRRRAATSSGSRLLGNNRFRNVTKTGENQAKGSILDKMDACTIHCVFDQLEMLNSNSRPDKSSIVNIMTNQIKDVELKEFIQDSIDECFDTLELDSHNNKCEFSKNFAICMENKAQKNCDDWDENMPTNKINSSQDGNNQQDKKRGY